MIRIGLYSDTHGFVEPRLYELFQDCDQIWHAGDIGSNSALEQLISFQKPYHAVYGNIDGSDLRNLLAGEMTWTCEGILIYMTHIGGYPGRYPAALRKKLKDLSPQIFVCGHSHILKVMYDQELKLLHLNPGACGYEGFHKVRTAMRFEINDGKVQNLQVIELGTRNRAG